MTALTLADRIDAVTALFGAPFVAGLALVVTFAVGYVLRAEQRYRARRRLPLGAVDLMAPWSDREPGRIDWSRMHHGICPKCGEDKFIGHGPLCLDCLGGAA